MKRFGMSITRPLFSLYLGLSNGAASANLLPRKIIQSHKCFQHIKYDTNTPIQQFLFLYLAFLCVRNRLGMKMVARITAETKNPAW